jgi:corrinoid protein of di/trimethylamine methyltransferase
MLEEKYFAELREAIIAGDMQRARECAEKIVKEGLDPLKAIEEAIQPAAKIVGEKFEKLEIFLVDLIMSADAMKAAAEVLTSAIKAKRPLRPAGKVVIATVQGDIHDIGKNIVAALLVANGFEVYDLGVDVPALKIIEKAEEVGADVIALSALMTSTMRGQKDVIDMLKAMGIRDKYIVVVGGGATTAEWAREIGADGWAETAPEGVSLIRRLIEEKRGVKP